ncbi:hypothetical protein LIER_37951 [Lithospermum erythrorhizon]|uniref:Integrase catalytic domain-containing protein n=1 Tax=Lithospermum erythrorhizon TaxID=34254 RepID=A0AAV3PVJ9_LITER
MVTNVFQAKIKYFQADEGGEFHKLEPYLNKHGIPYRYSCPATPQQNGIAERKHRHIVEKMRCLLFQSKLPAVFWFEALNYVIYLINRLPSPSLNNQTPYYLLFNLSPDYSMIKVFGCLCYPHLTKQLTSKYFPRSLPCIFLGVSLTHKGFRCYNPEAKRVLVSRHVTFFENVFPYSSFHPYYKHSNSLIFPSNYHFTAQDDGPVLPKSNTQISSSNSISSTSFLLSPPTNNTTLTSCKTASALPSTSPHTVITPILQSDFPSPVISAPADPLSPSSSHTNTIYLGHSPPSNTASPPPSPLIDSSTAQNISSLILPSSHNSSLHPMVTRSRNRITKTKQLTSLSASHTQSSSLIAPSCYTEALKSPYWQKAMAEEYNPFTRQHTWD